MNDVKWHNRLEHIGQDRLKRLAKASHLESIDKMDLLVCEQCLVGKQRDCLLVKPRDHFFFSFRAYSL